MAESQPRKPYVQRDRRYVVEYVTQEFPNDKSFFNLRLGPAPIGVAELYPGLDADRYARVWKKTCDAVVVTKDTVILIEGELRRPMESLGELIAYKNLLFSTPELKQFVGHKVRSLLLCPVYDPTLKTQFDANGIECVIFRPKWVDDYLKEVMR